MAECDACAGNIDENALREPADLIAGLRSGDIFHARSPNNASLICLVTAVGDSSISARRLTTQEDLVFDRQTGLELHGKTNRTSRIDSVEPLPTDIHNVFLVLDRRYRLGQGWNRFKLSDAEKAAILFVGDHYDEHCFSSVHAGLGQIQ